MIKADKLIRKKATPTSMDSLKERKKTLHIKDKDPDLLSLCNHLWMNFAPFREQRRRGNQFYDGDQWGDLITVNGESMTYRQYLSSTGNFVFQTNQIKNRVDTIAGVLVKQKTEPVCHAIDPDEQQYGEIITEAVQANCEKNVMQELYIKFIKEVCNGGLAVAYESFDDCSGPDRTLDSWTTYVSPNRIFFDGDGTDPRTWDLSIIGCVRYGSRDDICARFAKSPSDFSVLKALYPIQFDPSRAVRSKDATKPYDDTRLVFMDTSDPNRCFYCEVWTRESRPRIRLWDKNSGTEEIIDYNDMTYRREVQAENERRRRLAAAAGWQGDEEIPYIVGDGYGNEDERNGFFMDTFWYCRFLAPDGTILWEGESPYADRLHPFSLCIFSYIDGNIVGYNYDAIDHNMAINRQWVMGEWLKRTQAKGVVVVPKSIVPKGTDYKEFARSWTAIDELVFIDLKPGQEHLMPKVFYGAAQNYDVTRDIQLLKDLMDSGSPVNGALQGNDPGRATAASLYAQMASNASTPIAALLEQFNNFEHSILYKKMKNICMFYTEDRFRKIAGRIDSIFDMSKLNLNDVGSLEYDMRVREGSDTPVFREMQENDLMLFVDKGYITFDEYLQSSSKPYVDRLLQMRQARQAEMEAAQEAGVPVGAVPEAAPGSAVPANAAAPLQG